MIEQGRGFCLRGLARQGRQEKLGHDGAIVQFLPQQLANAIVGVPQAVVDCRAVNELQRLGQVAFSFTLAFASQLTRRLSEGFEKGMIGLPVGQLLGMRAGRVTGEFFRDLGDQAKSVE